MRRTSARRSFCTDKLATPEPELDALSADTAKANEALFRRVGFHYAPRAAISSFSSIGWIFSCGSDAIPFPQPKPRTVRIHIIMPSVCSRKVAQLKWSGVRKGENVLQPLNLCDRLLGVHSASIFTRSASPKESGFGQKLKPVPTGVGDVYTRYQSDPHALVSSWRDSEVWLSLFSSEE